MSQKSNLIEIRSEEVQEIISHVPNGLVRWGLTVIFFVMLTLFSITWFIKYPDLLTAQVVITTTPAPVNLVSRMNGKITLFKQDNQPCQKDEVIALIQSNAEMSAVLNLEKKLESAGDLKTSGSLGELQTFYSSWINSQAAITLFHQTAAYEKQIEQLNRQLNTYQKLNKSLGGQQRISKQELDLALQKFNTDSIFNFRK